MRSLLAVVSLALAVSIARADLDDIVLPPGFSIGATQDVSRGLTSSYRA